MENLNKELDRLAKLIVDRAERMNSVETISVEDNFVIDDANILSAEALAIISNTKALNIIVGLLGKKEKPIT